MPRSVSCRGEVYEHIETFKHDFFAATGLYRGPRGLCVLKMGRITEVFTLPTDWIGRFLARREAHFYERLTGLPGVPEFVGRVGPTGILHAFVPGHQLGRKEQVSDTFFNDLAALLGAIHERGMAYVDLNKRQNVLVGDDGRPYLIDFQISAHISRDWSRIPPLGWLLVRFQQADRYHLLKHKRRLRPDLLTDAERASVEHVSFWIRLHRVVARPLTNLRRSMLRRLGKSEMIEVSGASAK
ncbi:MAG: hypothetical protein JNG88_09445 [Phycisphaerales bacterium]|nr:hypothetical protein [Phycisphaerales bacterium]